MNSISTKKRQAVETGPILQEAETREKFPLNFLIRKTYSIYRETDKFYDLRQLSNKSR